MTDTCFIVICAAVLDHNTRKTDLARDARINNTPCPDISQVKKHKFTRLATRQPYNHNFDKQQHQSLLAKTGKLVNINSRRSTRHLFSCVTVVAFKRKKMYDKQRNSLLFLPIVGIGIIYIYIISIGRNNISLCVCVYIIYI